MDTQLVEKIVHEVKSQGVFDEFRKDSMADVDTKPAYQNLRQRVENTVKKFLAEQKWTPETNKNQLREKLRKHITESGFLDVGVERIVDQVVNPKIGSVFQPRIEEIAYKYLGLPPPPKKFEPPPPPLMHPLPPLPLNAPPLKVETCSLLPTDLEQVSPDSDKGTVKSEGKDDRTTVDMDTEEKFLDDEDESPPFEPLVKEEVEKTNVLVKVETKEEKPNIKQECEESSDDKTNKFEESNDAVVKTENMATDNDSQETSNFAPDSAGVDKDASQSVDARISQDSQLSSVSSDSRLSVNGKEDSLQSSSQEAVAANISEEAQMPKFNENSSEPNASTNGHVNEKISTKSELHFDIKKDEIKFEGTERKSGLEITETAANKSEEEAYEETPSSDTKNDSFKFNTDKSNMEHKEDDFERTPNAQELSFGSSIEDSTSVPPNQTSKAPTQQKEKDDLPQTPKQIIRPSTPNTTPIPTPPLPTPTATPSPVAIQKPDREHQSRHSSSSSSKHKKHSKERRRSYEREKEKEKDSRDRHRSSKDSKDSSRYHSSSSSANKSSSKHSSSSSSSKYSSSHNKSTEKDIEKSSSSSTHSSSKHTKHSHSHSSSSSNENQDSKKSKRDSERRHHSSSSSSTKRSERKDDHAEAKHKIQRRKSTDSNDDEGDKSVGGSKSSSQYKSSHTISSQGKSSKSKSNGNEGNRTNDTQKDQLEVMETNELNSNKSHHVNNVVILNDILENPQTQFIQLNNTGHLVETPVQQTEKRTTETETEQTVSAESNNNIAVPLESKEGKEPKEVEKEQNSMDLLYFDESQQNLTERLKLLNDTMDLCRSAVNSLRFDSLSDEGIELSNEEDINSDVNKPNNLLEESLKRKSDYIYSEFETTPRKRVMSQTSSEGCQSKTSPTLSDTSSINSKENEEIVKNTNHAKKSLIERHKAAQKLSQQQRYSSEDLYKPRPILGQRSRRRGMDSLV